ncbi:MAG: glycosyltransferase family 39 protein [Gemmatimonadales bacterium]
MSVPSSSDGAPRRPPVVLVGPPVFRPGLPGWLLIGTIGLGALLRFSAAAHGGLWRDEALFLFVSRIEPFSKLLGFLRQHESHPPGFYLLMRAWSELLGRSESAAVGLSLLIGVTLIPLVYYVGSRLFSWRVGLFAAALAAVSPPLIQLSILVRPYALLAALCVWTAYLLWECLREGGRGQWALYGVAMVLMLYIHNWTLLLYGAHGVIALAWIGTRPEPRRREILRPWLMTQAVILALYAPWLPVLHHQFTHAGHGPSPSLSSGPYLMAAKVLAGAKVKYAVPLLLLAAGAGLLAWRRNRMPPRGTDLSLGVAITAGIPLLVIAAATVISGETNLLPPWCVAVLAPLMVLLFARLLGWVHETGAWREAYASGAALLILYGLTWHFDPENLKSNARETAIAVAKRAAPGDLVIVTPETLASSFNYYFRPKNSQIDYPSMRREQVVRYDDRFGKMTSEATLQRALARIDTARAQGRRVWFVMEVGDMNDSFVRPLVAADTARDYLKPLVLKRSNQLRQHLVALYGQPTLTLTPAPGADALELLGALLFEPSSPATSASLAGRVSCQVIVPAGGRGDSAPAVPAGRPCE